MAEEFVIYDKGNIKITNLRAVFGPKTFSISNITSVEMQKNEPSSTMIFMLVILGFCLIFFGFPEIVYIFFGVVCIALFVLAYRAQKISWIVSLTTASGEVKAFEDFDQPMIKEIVDALNTAIIQKG